MKYTIKERAMLFLDALSIDDLKELVYSNELINFPNEHIARKFVDYVYRDDIPSISFSMCLMQLYPYIAQEAFLRHTVMLNDNENI